MMKSLARWCYTRRKTVLALWLVALIGVSALGARIGTRYTNTLSLPGTDSAKAEQILRADFPTRSGDSEQLVLAAHGATLRAPNIRREIEAMLSRVSELPHVRSVISPYSGQGQINASSSTGFAIVDLDRQAASVPKASVQRLLVTASSAASPRLSVALDGQAIETEEQSGGSASLAVGALLALLVLFFAFRRSLRGAVLPLASALAGIGVTTGLVDALTHVMAIASWEPQVATLVALGVGVDYALFIVSRHRTGLLRGESPERSAIVALDTSGRAVLLAGLTVCLALLGMFFLGVGMLDGVAVCVALSVALTMLASLTLLPALLAVFGPRILPRAERGQRPGQAFTPGLWYGWARIIERRAPLSAVLAFAVVTVLALPLLGIRIGLPDASTDPTSSTSHHAYTLLAKGFGPGFSGPLELVAHFTSPAAPREFDAFIARLRDQPGVARLTPPRQSRNHRAAIALLYATSRPQAAQTDALLQRVRAEASRAERARGLDVHIGGDTAINHDFSALLSRKLPLFLVVVIAVSFLLLATVFRSILIPTLAAIMNLVSFGAALGVMTATFQNGWGRSILGFGQSGPIVSYLPVMMFAILFGLSTDYEVFLISRIQEEWNRSGRNSIAVTRGQTATGRIITAAALIMVLVFSAFIPSNEFALKQIGLGFVVAILVDAFIVRTILLPAAMHLFGRANWWAPAWLNRTRAAIEPSRG